MSKAREEAGGPVGRSDRWFAWWQQWDVFLSKNGQGLLDVEMWKNRREQGCSRLCWWGRGGVTGRHLAPSTRSVSGRIAQLRAGRIGKAPGGRSE